MRRIESRLWILLILGLVSGCSEGPDEVPLQVPHGYMNRLRVIADGHYYGFGPFVGYYFKPQDPADVTRIDFLCFNEGRFYASDAPANALLYEGEARLVRLPPVEVRLQGEASDRIRPLFFPNIPANWLATRPEPREEYVHFHSCYDARGPALVGYWLRHEAKRAFTYDMGGRVGPGGPLYHAVVPGPDAAFANSVEFDRGPGPHEWGH